MLGASSRYCLPTVIVGATGTCTCRLLLLQRSWQKVAVQSLVLRNLEWLQKPQEVVVYAGSVESVSSMLALLRASPLAQSGRLWEPQFIVRNPEGLVLCKVRTL